MRISMKCLMLVNASNRLFKNEQLLKTCTSFFSTSSAHNQFKLSEVGFLNSIKKENYESGQLFVHKLFGYRGVILFPWTANITEKSDESELNDEQYKNQMAQDLELEHDFLLQMRKNATAKKLTYYQVLIDNRDIPYMRMQPEAVTFLTGSGKYRSVYSVHGLDYVSQIDVLPYTTTEKIPIIHELYDKLLMPDSESKSGYSPREALKTWQEGNHTWLELSDVFIGVTNNIRVTVIPFYIGIKEEQSKKMHWWRYSIRIENLSKVPVTLRERQWKIFSRAGTFNTTGGRGVVGQEPYLSEEYPVFQYSSHVNLQAPSGHMWGTFKMERDDGTFFDVRIPSFHLESKEEEKTLNS